MHRLTALMLATSLALLFHNFGFSAEIHGGANVVKDKEQISPDSEDLGNDSIALEPLEIRMLGENKQPVDLLTALRLASAGNLEIAEAKTQILEAEGNKMAAIGQLLPFISLFFGYGHTEGRVQGSFGDFMDVDFNTINPGVIAGYFINPGETLFNNLASQRIVDSSRAKEAVITQDILLRVFEQYYNLLEAQAKVKVSEDSVSSSASLLRVAEALEKEGLGPGADVVRARTKLEEDKQTLIESQNEFRRASADLAFTLVLNPSITLIPNDEKLTLITIIDPRIDLSKLMSIAILQNPGIRVASETVKASDAERSAVWLNALGPDLILQAELGGIGDEFDNIQHSESYQALLGFTLTGSSYGDIKAARARAQRAIILEEKEKERIKTTVVKAYDDVLSAKEMITPAKAAVNSAEDTLRLSQVRFKNGIGLAIEVIQAEDALSEARLNYIRAIVDYNKSQARLANAIGDISLDTITGKI
jgi:outer membrane protein TolC